MIEKIVFATMKRLDGDYMFLDDIEYLCVNIVKKEVSVMLNKRKVPILTKSKSIWCENLNIKVYKLERKTIERFIDIVVKNKSNKNHAKEDLQLEIKASIETLNAKLEYLQKRAEIVLE